MDSAREGNKFINLKLDYVHFLVLVVSCKHLSRHGDRTSSLVLIISLFLRWDVIIHSTFFRVIIHSSRGREEENGRGSWNGRHLIIYFFIPFNLSLINLFLN
jgi:hypothetical protein